MKTEHKLTPKQTETLKQFQAAFAELESKRQLYIKAIFDAADLDPSLEWKLSDDLTRLVST